MTPNNLRRLIAEFIDFISFTLNRLRKLFSGRSQGIVISDGTSEQPYVRAGKKIGRNDPCPCVISIYFLNNVKKLPVNGSFFQARFYITLYQKRKEKSSVFFIFLYTFY